MPRSGANAIAQPRGCDAVGARRSHRARATDARARCETFKSVMRDLEAGDVVLRCLGVVLPADTAGTGRGRLVERRSRRGGRVAGLGAATGDDVLTRLTRQPGPGRTGIACRTRNADGQDER